VTGFVLSAEDRAAIEALHHAWLSAELRGDVTALLGFCTSVPVWLPPNEPPLCGAAAIQHWLEHQPHATLRRIDIHHLEISGIGSFACKHAIFRSVVDSAEGSTVVVNGVHSWLLQRDDAGVWRVWVVAWTIA